MYYELNQDSPELLEAMEAATGFQCGVLNTGGGCTVLAIDLSQDARFLGRQVWLTREAQWVLGFYDFSKDEQDEGVTVYLIPRDADDATSVAAEVAGILTRLGTTYH